MMKGIDEAKDTSEIACIKAIMLYSSPHTVMCQEKAAPLEGGDYKELIKVIEELEKAGKESHSCGLSSEAHGAGSSSRQRLQCWPARRSRPARCWRAVPRRPVIASVSA